MMHGILALAKTKGPLLSATLVGLLALPIIMGDHARRTRLIVALLREHQKLGDGMGLSLNLSPIGFGCIMVIF